MVVLLTCKNKEDPIKNEGARVFTTLYIDFSDTRGRSHFSLLPGPSRTPVQKEAGTSVYYNLT